MHIYGHYPIHVVLGPIREQRDTNDKICLLWSDKHQDSDYQNQKHNWDMIMPSMAKDISALLDWIHAL